MYSNTKYRPIGIFDSGIGGVTVMKEIRQILPHEDIVYYADTANCPYGEKNKEQITILAENAVDLLKKQGAKIIIIACNTASIIASKPLRDKYDIHIVAIEPAVKPAVQSSESKSICVIATKATVNSGQIELLANTFGKDVNVIKVVGEGLVEIVEGQDFYSQNTKEVINKIITPAIESNCDHIVLGCTHYPFLKEAISEVLRERDKGDIKILDAALPTARRVEWILNENSLLNDRTILGRDTFLSSGTEEERKNVEQIFKKFIGND